MDHIRDIAEEICRQETGRDYSALADPVLITELFRKATIVRYLRHGIEPTWIESAVVDPLRRYIRGNDQH